MSTTKGHNGASLERVVRRRRKPCALCEGMEIESPPWDKKEWACRPCWNGYVNFRRAFKIEHGLYPTFEEVMADDELLSTPKPNTRMATEASTGLKQKAVGQSGGCSQPSNVVLADSHKVERENHS